jgi:hypothetical protein
MYVSLGTDPECTSHYHCPGADMYCEGGECVYKPEHEMAECVSDDECYGEYFCIGGRCGKLPPPVPPVPPTPKPPAPGVTPPAPAQVSSAKPDLTFIIVAAAVAGGLAYLVGRQP